jgi:hypothetical protein
LVALSCKGRGFCPSCGGRRMTERAAHLVDHVLPRAPVRQWVLSLPFELRYRVQWDLARSQEEMDVRVRRAKIGLGSSAAALFAGGMFVGVGIAESYSACDFFEECAPVPKRYTAYLWTGTALLVGGFAGMVASGILLRRRKFERDWLRQAHYGTPRRAQWDLARSRLVF